MLTIVQMQQILQKEFHHISVSDEQVQKIADFLKLLNKWNQKINLTSLKESQKLFNKHILDTLIPLRYQIPLQGKIIDLGSGAGLPGIILSIFFPHVEIVSVEKLRKKIIFQEVAKEHLGLTNFKPLLIHTEKLHYHHEHKEQYDFLVSRAFTSINDLMLEALHFLCPGGSLILWKGENWKNEYKMTLPTYQKQFSLTSVDKYHFQSFNGGGVLLTLRKK